MHAHAIEMEMHTQPCAATMLIDATILGAIRFRDSYIAAVTLGYFLISAHLFRSYPRWPACMRRQV